MILKKKKFGTKDLYITFARFSEEGFFFYLDKIFK